METIKKWINQSIERFDKLDKFTKQKYHKEIVELKILLRNFVNDDNEIVKHYLDNFEDKLLDLRDLLEQHNQRAAFKRTNVIYNIFDKIDQRAGTAFYGWGVSF